MKLLLFLLICFSKGEIQPSKQHQKHNLLLDDVKCTKNRTTATYSGNGTLTLVLGQEAIGAQIIIIEEGITAIEDFAFSRISTPIPGIENIFSYQKVYLPRSLVSIGKYAFSSVNSNLTTCLFPFYNGTNTEAEKEKYYALRTIGEGAFSDCTKLININIPNTVTSIENYVFKSVPITGYTLNSKVTSIGIGSFQNSKITNITIPESVTSIGAFAFGNCSNLQTITFNTKSCSFGGESFKNCANLKEFTFPESAHLSLPGGILENCPSLTKCTMPKTLTDENGIESTTINMFTNDKSLNEVILPTNIKKIGMKMFENTSIEQLYLPTSVNFIDAEAFKDCTKLKYVNVSSTEPTTLGLNTFDNTPNLELLSVHGDLSVDMGEDMFGGKKFCYYGTKNPKGSKLALDPSTTKVYVTKEFKETHDTFGGIVTGDDFNGYPCEIMTGSVCSFPGEPGLPIESESESISESELISSSNEEESTLSESNNSEESFETSLSTESENTDNDDNNKHDKKKKKKLSTGAIIGIVLGCLAFLALLILLIVCCCKKHKNNDNIETKDERKESSIALKKTPSKKDYESVDNIKDDKPEKIMV